MKHLHFSLLCGSLLLGSCTATVDNLSDGAPVVANYGAMLYAEYDDAHTGAAHLRTSATPLFSSGTSATDAALIDARASWRAARVAYMEAEVARFYGGPIGEHSDFTNEWPIDEAQIDYVAGTGGTPTFGGIVNMPSTPRCATRISRPDSRRPPPATTRSSSSSGGRITAPTVRAIARSPTTSTACR
jgi:hypothetical protein